MKIYWSYKQMPELTARTPEARDVVVKQLNSFAIKHWEWWIALLVAGVLTGFGAYFGGTGLAGALGAGIGAGLGSVLHTQVVIYIMRKYYANVLVAQSDA